MDSSNCYTSPQIMARLVRSTDAKYVPYGFHATAVTADLKNTPEDLHICMQQKKPSITLTQTERKRKAKRGKRRFWRKSTAK